MLAMPVGRADQGETEAREAVLDPGDKGVDPGMKSLAISVRLQPRDRTLTDAEIDTVASRIIGSVTKACGATLRS